ncbi:MAG: hypothetical protein HY037_02675 [Nitrospirae bacterium]|nr:hypothetical protein [Candidatus Troglogloeales bacterium]
MHIAANQLEGRNDPGLQLSLREQNKTGRTNKQFERIRSRPDLKKTATVS